MSAIPGEWKLKLRDYGRKLTNTWHTSVKNLFESKKTVKYIYKMFIEKKAAKKVLKETFTGDPSSSVMNYAKMTVVVAGSLALKDYLGEGKVDT